MDRYIKEVSDWMRENDWITVEHGGILYSGTLESLMRVISQKEKNDRT